MKIESVESAGTLLKVNRNQKDETFVQMVHAYYVERISRAETLPAVCKRISTFQFQGKERPPSTLRRVESKDRHIDRLHKQSWSDWFTGRRSRSRPI